MARQECGLHTRTSTYLPVLWFLTGTEYETRPDVRCPHAWPGIRPGLGVAAVVHIN